MNQTNVEGFQNLHFATVKSIFWIQSRYLFLTFIFAAISCLKFYCLPFLNQHKSFVARKRAAEYEIFNNEK